MSNFCKNCGASTKNPKFCSRSCSASFTNKESPKRKRKTVCANDDCDEITYSYRHKLCEKHHYERLESRKRSYKYMTVGEYRDKLSVKGKHCSWLNSHVRLFAKAWLKHLRDKPCANCGYELHVELCHIKAVSSFPDSALLGEINSESNVIQLCPNCHWELDNGYMSIEDILK